MFISYVFRFPENTLSDNKQIGASNIPTSLIHMGKQLSRPNDQWVFKKKQGLTQVAIQLIVPQGASSQLCTSVQPSTPPLLFCQDRRSLVLDKGDGANS